MSVAHRLPRDRYVVAGARAASILGNVVAVTALLLDFHDGGTGAWAVAGLLAAGALPIVLLAHLAGSRRTCRGRTRVRGSGCCSPTAPSASCWPAAIGCATASFTAVHRTAGLIAYGLGGLVVGLLRPEAVYVLSGAAALVIVLVLAPRFRQAWALC